MRKIQSLEQFLLEHSRAQTVSFHMPGHKGSALYRQYGHDTFLNQIMDCDVTEIPGADNLFQAEGRIRQIQDRYARLYGAKASYLLVNSTSGGLMAAIMTAVPRGGSLIMARNSHKAVFNTLQMAGVHPFFAYPETVPEWNISGPVLPEEILRCIREHPDAAAVILPSPNYYGICSDVRMIADLCHAEGKILIVDQAHGAHLAMFQRFDEEAGMSLPPSAESSGADLVVDSIHKTLASFTQSAVLHVMSDRVDCTRLEDKLQAVQSSSPSYLLMTSLEINADILEQHGKECMMRWRHNLDLFYQEAETIPGIRVMEHPLLDRTKINLDAGISGDRLQQAMLASGIVPELTSGNLVMCMTGIGNTEQDMQRLLRMLASSSASLSAMQNDSGRGKTVDGSVMMAFQRPEPPVPVEEIPEQYEDVPLAQAAGRIAAAGIIPYPPGIPLVCSGERISASAVAFVQDLRRHRHKVVGVSEQGTVRVGRSQ